MSRSLKDVIGGLPSARQRAIEARYLELREEVEGLRALREVVGQAQADIAEALSIKQPSVSKIERQADMYLSTLRGYVEAMGGSLELVVQLPSKRIVLKGLGDVLPLRDTKTPKRRKASPHRGRD